MGSVTVGGMVEPGWEGVHDAFARNFEAHGEVGARCAVHHDGRPVVDLWGGVADQATGRAYDDTTLQLVFSTTKGVTATAANLLIQRGLLDPDAPVATYWPEFAAEGKGAIPVRWLLCHKGGLPYVDAELTLEQGVAWGPVVEALAATVPKWEPGTAHGYHALTYGWLVGELVRRVSGKSLGAFVADEIAGPLGLDLWIGLPVEHEHRVAPIIPAPEPEDPAALAMAEQFAGPATLLGRTLSLSGTFPIGVWNLPEVHAAQIGAANCITDARSLSRFYAGVIGTVDAGPTAPLLDAATVDAARTTQTSGADKVLFLESTFGLGFMTSSLFSPYGGAGSFGHTGAGGSVAFADPDHGLGFGYAMNAMQQSLTGDERTKGLIRAVYEAIGVTPTCL